MDAVYSFTTSEGIEELLQDVNSAASISVSATTSAPQKQTVASFREGLTKLRPNKMHRGDDKVSKALFALQNHVQSVNNRFESQLNKSSMNDMMMWKSTCLENKLKWKNHLNNLSDDDDDYEDVRREYDQWKTQLSLVKNQLDEKSVPVIDPDSWFQISNIYTIHV